MERFIYEVQKGSANVGRYTDTVGWIVPDYFPMSVTVAFTSVVGMYFSL